MLKKAIIFICVLLLSSIILAQADVTAVTLVALNMRDAPSASGHVITKRDGGRARFDRRLAAGAQRQRARLDGDPVFAAGSGDEYP